MEKEWQLRIERLEAVVQIQNIVGRYQAYHSAGRHQEIVDLFAKKTPGGKCIFNGNIFEGYEGVRNHFLVLASEPPLTGMLCSREMVTPIIEVAGDAQTAKAQFSSIGAETVLTKNQGLVSLWEWDKFHIDFVKEDGEWKIYNMDFHTTFFTPYEGKGWTEEPCYDVMKNIDPKLLPPAMDNKSDGFTAVEYKPLSLTSPDCDIHNLIPEPPLPYDKWDVLKDPWAVEKK